VEEILSEKEKHADIGENGVAMQDVF